MIVGTWYGMNFAHMPELEQRHAYIVVGVLTLLFTLGTIIYFRTKRWF
jgi:magnesium transporter